jgi:hypothetical protein
LAAIDGPLACERIVDVCDKIVTGRPDSTKPHWQRRLKGHGMATIRTLKRKVKARLPRSRNKPEFHRHRYPEVTLEEMLERVSRLQQVLGESRKLQVERILGQFFRISP